MRVRWLVAGLIAGSLGASCGRGAGSAAETDPVPLVVLVRDHRRAPLAGAAIEIDGAVVGVTGGDGLLETALSGPDGRRVDVVLSCPEGLIPAGDSRREITVRRMRPVAAVDDRLATVETCFACAPAMREHLLVVRTDGRAGLPVLVNGEAAATTGPSGAAHVVVSRPPGEEIEVVLDTATNENLRPRSPSRRLRLPEEPRLILFDQRFDERKPKVAPRRRKAALPRRL